MIKKICALVFVSILSSVLFGMDQDLQELQRQLAQQQRQEEALREQQLNTPIHHLMNACIAGNEQEVLRLIDVKKVDPNMRLFLERNFHNSTCLHYAVAYPAVVRLLLDRGADTNPRDQNGWIPLIPALAGGYEETVHLLIARGAKIESIDNVQGYRPIATPIQCLHPRLVSTLLKAGAKVIPPPMTLHQGIPLHRIYQGNVLHILCERLQFKPTYAPEYDAQEIEDRALEIIEIIRRHGIDMDHVNVQGNTVFHAAAPLNNRRIIAALLISSQYTDIIRKLARGILKTALLCNQRNGNTGENPQFPCEDNSLPVLPREVMLRIFSHMPIECKQANIEQLIVPHICDAATMRTRHLDACWKDIKKYSWYTLPEAEKLLKTLGIINANRQRAHELTKDNVIMNVLAPHCWH
jgi:ankyrin repeat protein